MLDAARKALAAKERLERPLRLDLPGLSAPVEVVTDSYGVPHIYASSAYDLFYVQGFVTARDRLFQMDYTRHVAQGRLCELVGVKPVPWREMTVQFRGFDTLDADVLIRSIGLAESAEASLPLHSPDIRAILDAYADGVSAYISTGARSPEHMLLNATIAPWQPMESILMFKAIGLETSSAWRAALFGAMLVQAQVPEDVARLIWPAYPLTGSNIVGGSAQAAADAQSVLAASDAAREASGLGNRPGLGSNSFTVAGTHTATGDAILANDTHLMMQAPSRWHEVGLHGGGYELQGFALAGMPGVAIGRTPHHAWGITSALAQDLDVFVEKMHPVNPHRYLTPDGWQELEESRATFHVKGKPSVERTLLRTRHGPLIDVATKPKGRLRYALGWAGMEPSRDFEGLARSWKAKSFETFRAALEDIKAVPFNISYAGRDGDIGYVMTGNIPNRRVGAPTLPLEGWTGEWEWRGRIPYSEHPWSYNPECGYIVTANQRCAPGSYPYELGGAFEPNERADRITERLNELGSAITFDDLCNLQLDTRSLMGRVSRDAYIAIAGGVDRLGQGDPVARAAALAWRDWDCETRRESVGATVAYMTVFELAQNIVRQLGGEGAVWGLFEQPAMSHLPLGRFPRAQERLRELGVDLAQETRDAFWRTVERCSDELGSDVWKWTWGRVHQLTCKHPFHHAPGLGPMFSIGPMPSDGSTDTVNRGDVNGANNLDHRAGAAMRMVMSARDLDRGATILPGGQSGNPLSRHYDDQFADFLSGRFKPAPFHQPHGRPESRENFWPCPPASSQRGRDVA